MPTHGLYLRATEAGTFLSQLRALPEQVSSQSLSTARSVRTRVRPFSITPSAPA